MNTKFNTTSESRLKDIYPKYFQKSKQFFWPLVGLNRFLSFQPRTTHLGWTSADEVLISPEDNQIIAVYPAVPAEHAFDWDLFMDNYLLKNRHFVGMYMLEGTSDLAFQFDLSAHASDGAHLREGRYSQLSPRLKAAVGSHNGVGSANWAYLETFLNPDRHFAHYAKLLCASNDPADIAELEKNIRQSGELCDKPDMILETLTISAVPIQIVSSDSVIL